MKTLQQVKEEIAAFNAQHPIGSTVWVRSINERSYVPRAVTRAAALNFDLWAMSRGRRFDLGEEGFLMSPPSSYSPDFWVAYFHRCCCGALFSGTVNRSIRDVA